MEFVGPLALWLALLMAAWSALATVGALATHRDDLALSGRRAAFATAGFACIALFGFIRALLTADLSVRAVASYASGNLPRFYKLGALWVSPVGTLLFWSAVLAVCACVVLVTNRASRTVSLRTHATLALVILCVTVLSAIAANPFERLAVTPPDGRGLHPMYQHVEWPLHALFLHMGYVLTCVPFALTVSTGLGVARDHERTRAVDRARVASTWRWSLAALLCVTLALVLGMRWTYVQADSARVWNWDAAHASALVVWLILTALAISLPLERATGAMHKWNAALATVALPLALGASIVARSGVVQSAQAFPTTAPLRSVLAVMVALLLVGVWTVSRAHDAPMPRAQRGRVVAALSIACAILALSVVWGIAFPGFSAWFSGDRVLATPAFFDAVNAPLCIIVLLLAGATLCVGVRRVPRATIRLCLWPAVAGTIVAIAAIVSGMYAPIAAVGVGAATFVLVSAIMRVARTPRAIGVALACAGAAVLSAGISSGPSRAEHRITIAPGARVVIRDPFDREWTFTSQGVSFSEEANRRAQIVAVRAERSGHRAALIRTELRQHFNASGDETFAASLVPGVLSLLTEDVFVVFDHATAGGTALLRIAFNPFVMLIWIGGTMTVVGGIAVLVPRGIRPA